MKPSLIAQAITACMEINRPLFIWGPPGVGKSDTVRQAVFARRARAIAADATARKLSEEDSAALMESAMSAPLSDGTYFGLIDFRAALRDAVDIMGLPAARDGQTFYNAPAGLPGAGWRGIVFLDEMNSAPPATQAALYQLVLDRAVGDYKLPDGAFIVAAGNRANDRGVVHRMPDPLADRFFHADFETDMSDWCAHAAACHITPEVIGFIRFRPAHLHIHDTKRECHAITTPRGWFDVSRVLGLRLEGALEGELVRGRVGGGAASEFLAYLKLYRNMVSPDEVLAKPRTADVPRDVGILYALAEALARRATADNIGAVFTYAGRIPPEYAQCLVSSMTRLTPELCNTPDYLAWIIKNGNK